jgi:glycosyltransferase involved in cell wall biosynthesis
MAELRAMRRLRAGEDEEAVMFRRNEAFQRAIPEREFADSDVVIGFDTSSWVLAERAAAAARPLVLDRTSIGHAPEREQLFSDLRRRFPEWAEDFPTRLPELIEAESEEHLRSSRIVVASSYTRRILIETGIPAEKIIVTPLGVDLEVFSPIQRHEESRPLRFIFVGAVGARKGVPVLLDAWRQLSPRGAEMWLAGSVENRHRRVIPALPGLRMLGKVPHRELAGVLGKCDVLVLPSFFEGFGLVLLEALAMGMPIIATDATAAPDLITDGVEGCIVPVGDSVALAGAMQRLIESRAELPRMSAAARGTAEQYSWDAYGDRWNETLQKVA